MELLHVIQGQLLRAHPQQLHNITATVEELIQVCGDSKESSLPLLSSLSLHQRHR